MLQYQGDQCSLPSLTLILKSPLSLTPLTCSKAHSLHDFNSASFPVQRFRAMASAICIQRDHVRIRRQILANNSPSSRTRYPKRFSFPLPPTIHANPSKPHQIRLISTLTLFEAFFEITLGGMGVWGWFVSGVHEWAIPFMQTAGKGEVRDWCSGQKG